MWAALSVNQRKAQTLNPWHGILTIAMTQNQQYFAVSGLSSEHILGS